MGRVAPDRRREMISQCMSTLDGPFPGQECVHRSFAEHRVATSDGRNTRSCDEGLSLGVPEGRCHGAATRAEIHGLSNGTNRDERMWTDRVVSAGMRDDSLFLAREGGFDHLSLAHGSQTLTRHAATTLPRALQRRSTSSKVPSTAPTREREVGDHLTSPGGPRLFVERACFPLRADVDVLHSASALTIVTSSCHYICCTFELVLDCSAFVSTIACMHSDAKADQLLKSQDEVLDVAAAARLLHLGRNSVYELVSRNKIPHRRLGKQIRFSRAAILAWLASWAAKEGK